MSVLSLINYDVNCRLTHILYTHLGTILAKNNGASRLNSDDKMFAEIYI